MGTDESYEQYRSRIGEEAAKIVLQDLGGLILEKLAEKKNQRNPDYVIKDTDENRIAVCEVKALVDLLTTGSSAEGLTHEEERELMKKRDANHRSKLRRQLGQAIKQLADHKDVPTVVCFVSFDMTDYIDMGQVLQDHIDLHPTDPIPDSFILMKIHQDVVPSATFKVTDTVRVMFNSEAGRIFGEKYLNWSEAYKRVGPLPLTFKL